MRFSIRLAGLWGAVLIAGALMPWGAGSTRAAEVDEYVVKAAFLHNLAKFVDWPPAKAPHPDASLVVGVFGDGAIEKFDSVLHDKTIDRHNILVRQVVRAEDVYACHILFVTRFGTGPAEKLLLAASKNGVLIAGETPGFLESGGMLRFYLEADNLRLEIDDQALRDAGLTIKASALSLLLNKGLAKLRKH
jgi:YfiR/HmsC-like